MKKFIVSTLILLFAFTVGGIAWWNNGTRAANPKDASQKEFVIAQGEGSKQISFALKDAGLIQDPIVFFLLFRFGGYDNKIEAGDFQLSPNQTPYQILTTLTHGTQDVWTTIPEGLRATEIAAILSKKIPSYTPSWSIQLQNQEGYLFPDTYLFPKDATIDSIISIMENNFHAKYAIAQKMQTNTLTQTQVIILASIVQREAITPHDMQYVASVLENRLSLGMALGSDVTIEYALGYQVDTKTWWKKDLTVADLAIDSPYNTRKVAGLPPTPISNPGLVAIEAVVNPPASDYLYYISDSKGVLHFAKTLQEHNANIVKYGE